MTDDYSVMLCDMYGTPVQDEKDHVITVYRGGVDLAGVEIEYRDLNIRMEVNTIAFERHGDNCVILEADLKVKYACVTGGSRHDAETQSPLLELWANDRTIKFIGEDQRDKRYLASQIWTFPCLRGWEVYLCDVSRYTLSVVFRRCRSSDTENSGG